MHGDARRRAPPGRRWPASSGRSPRRSGPPTPNRPLSAPARTKYIPESSRDQRRRATRGRTRQRQHHRNPEQQSSFRGDLQVVVVRRVDAEQRRRALVHQHDRFIRARAGARQPEIAQRPAASPARSFSRSGGRDRRAPNRSKICQTLPRERGRAPAPRASAPRRPASRAARAASSGARSQAPSSERASARPNIAERDRLATSADEHKTDRRPSSQSDRASQRPSSRDCQVATERLVPLVRRGVRRQIAETRAGSPAPPRCRSGCG